MAAVNATIKEFRLEFDPATYPGEANVFLLWADDAFPTDVHSVNLGAFAPEDIVTAVSDYATTNTITFTQMQIK